MDLPAREYAGSGFLAGQAPAVPSDPNSPDGRFRILNVPSRGRVCVFERGTINCVASVLSAADGTWRVSYLDTTRPFTVIGYDDIGQQNAAIQDWVYPVAMS
jgi:hypothetical protein